MTEDDLDRLIAAMQPGWLDWLSGLVVPVLLAGATLAVAIWAGRTAAKSNELAREKADDDRLAATRAFELEKEKLEDERRAADKSHAVEHRRLRALFGHELRQLASRITSARVAGVPAGSSERGTVDDLTRFSLAQVQADDRTARHIARWVTTVCREWPLKHGDMDGIIALNEKIRDGVDRWIEDPMEIIDMVEQDGVNIDDIPLTLPAPDRHPETPIPPQSDPSQQEA